MEIEREKIKMIMKHLSICEAQLNVNLRDYIKEDMEKAKKEYEDWKKYGMADEWNKRQNYFENILETINKERKFYSKICKELEKKGLPAEEWIFIDIKMEDLRSIETGEPKLEIETRFFPDMTKTSLEI